MSNKVLYEKKGEIAYITLNRPDVKNAIDLEVHHRLREIWTDFRDDRALRVAILTGAGDAFCAGADLRTHVPEWAEAGPSLARDKLPDGFAGGITRGLHRLYKPIIAACNGWVLGGRQCYASSQHPSLLDEDPSETRYFALITSRWTSRPPGRGLPEFPVTSPRAGNSACSSA